jgi:hypothetical protein
MSAAAAPRAAATTTTTTTIVPGGGGGATSCDGDGGAPRQAHLVSPSDVAAAVAGAAAAAGLTPPTPGVPTEPCDPTRAQAVADEVTAGVLARLAGLGAPVKWVVSTGVAEAGSGAGVHAGTATSLESGDGSGCYAVQGDGLEGLVSVWWVRV